MVREDLVSSAVSFLQDPSVATSPIDKRKAFLQSKNLTQEEIDIALARAGENAAVADTVPPSSALPTNFQYSNQPSIRQPPPGYGYGSYQGGPWGPLPPPPETPRRDWRDWFIMATVTGGVSYGLYTIAKRYVLPLIAPPTPPQLEQDKSEIDASFNRAFALIDQLATDTAAIKSAEAERSEKLDSALQEVESVLSELKIASKRREDDSRRIGDEVRALKDMIPKALEGWKADGDGRLKDLGTELSSLKKLVGNRMGNGSIQTPPGRPYGPVYGERENASGSGTPRDPLAPGPPYSSSGAGETEEDSSTATRMSAIPAPAPGVNVPKKEGLGSFSLDNKPGGRAAIPAWQMAASGRKSKASNTTTNNMDLDGTNPNETGVEA